ncbi:MarR family winged helix-turn-helix transcriptional regulator [Pararhizobium haloflavum]|uniref:MarR family winged helix-turn-helix transcriptional regulator n=1 Tax=Pararhizobium haloflavum TaxID=2037914 RepID=UPI000C176646|nr:MarR family transcriptional regulator [Pararhizobium haloflavum]
MSRSVDPDSLGFVITDLGRLLRAAVERKIAERGLDVTPGEARALVHAAALGGGRQTLLAERLGVEPMTVSGYIDRLEQRGLLTRRADPNDGRAKIVEVTDAADQLIDEARVVSRSVLDDIMSDIAEEERDAFERVIRSMRGRLQNRLGCGKPGRSEGEPS